MEGPRGATGPGRSVGGPQQPARAGTFVVASAKMIDPANNSECFTGSLLEGQVGSETSDYPGVTPDG